MSNRWYRDQALYRSFYIVINFSIEANLVKESLTKWDIKTIDR